MPFSNPITAGNILVQPAIQSPNFSLAAMTGWAVEANGNAYFFNITATGTITSTTVVVQGATGGMFVYSGVPASGNLIASATGAPGTDSHGNAYKAGISSYQGVNVAELLNASLGFYDTTFTVNPAAIGLLGSGVTGQSLQISSGNTTLGVNVGALQITDANTGLIATVPLMLFGGTIQAAWPSAAGQLLVIQNTTASPSNSNAEIICAAAADNALGIMVNGDTFNRVKVTTRALSMGGGTSTQDTQIYRSAAGTWGADTILANISGSAETWHSLGALTGGTVGIAQYRMLPTGMIHFDIEISFGVSTAWPAAVAFANTLPSAYRMPGSVDAHIQMASTNAAGAFGRIFVGSSGGGSAGQVQFASLNNGAVIGNYGAHFDLPAI